MAWEAGNKENEQDWLFLMVNGDWKSRRGRHQGGQGQDRGCEGRGWAEALAGVQVWECEPRRQAGVLRMRCEADL